MLPNSAAATAEQPVFVEAVLDPKPWGSQNLAALGLELPPDTTIGEALLTSPQSRIGSSSHQGSTLEDLANSYPETWVGARGLAATRGRPIFPLLVKVIDANQDLSIQVHPSDELVLAMEGINGPGKTEAWHILAAEDESVVYLGLTHATTKTAFANACRVGNGIAAPLLRQMPARPGATYIVPAGTAHAIGAGVMIYEIQQPSTITYRLDDWGRVDASGAPRQLHVDAGLAALDETSRPEPVPDVIVQRIAPRRELLAATRYFALERITFAAGDTWNLIPVESPQVLTLQRGLLHLAAGRWSAVLSPWQTLVVPVGSEIEVRGHHSGILLRGWVPDLTADIRVPARAAGIPESSLVALGIHVGATTH